MDDLTIINNPINGDIAIYYRGNVKEVTKEALDAVKVFLKMNDGQMEYVDGTLKFESK